MKDTRKENKKEKKKLGLTTKIFIALLLGAVFGIILNYVIPDSNFKSEIVVNGVLYIVEIGRAHV